MICAARKKNGNTSTEEENIRQSQAFRLHPTNIIHKNKDYNNLVLKVLHQTEEIESVPEEFEMETIENGNEDNVPDSYENYEIIQEEFDENLGEYIVNDESNLINAQEPTSVETEEHDKDSGHNRRVEFPFSEISQNSDPRILTQLQTISYDLKLLVEITKENNELLKNQAVGIGNNNLFDFVGITKIKTVNELYELDEKLEGDEEFFKNMVSDCRFNYEIAN